jgi:hypothetical protein
MLTIIFKMISISVMPEEDEFGGGDHGPDRTLRALANRKSERALLDVATWLEMKSDTDCSPALCRLIAMHYDLLAGHREVAGRSEMVAQYRRRAIHWRMRAAAYVRYLDQCDRQHPLTTTKPQAKRFFQEDLI